MLNGELYEKNGETYLKFISNQLKVKVGGGKVQLDNLFNGDKVLCKFYLNKYIFQLKIF